MRSTSCLHFDDYICEVKSHCHLNPLEQARGNCRCDGAPNTLDPESSPQEHSAEHPTRFDDTRRAKPCP